jgi:hypothetical protein
VRDYPPPITVAYSGSSILWEKSETESEAIPPPHLIVPYFLMEVLGKVKQKERLSPPIVHRIYRNRRFV